MRFVGNRRKGTWFTRLSGPTAITSLSDGSEIGFSNGNKPLAEEISSGALTVGNRLEEVLNEIGEGGPLVLAAALWATEFKGKDAELLFRWLVALIDREAPPESREDEDRRGRARDRSRFGRNTVMPSAIETARSRNPRNSRTTWN